MSVKQALLAVLVGVGLVGFLAPIAYTWRQMIWGSPPPLAATTLPKEYPKLTPEQAKRIQERVDQRIQERITEEKKKWEAGAAPKVTEDEFMVSVLP